MSLFDVCYSLHVIVQKLDLPNSLRSASSHRITHCRDCVLVRWCWTRRMERASREHTRQPRSRSF